jgi:hypothetical protein
VDLETGQPLYYDFHAEHLPIYSLLESLIFPADLGIEENELKVVDSGQVADHKVMIVDWTGQDGGANYQLWIDAYTGMVLRLLQFAEYSESVTYEVVMTSIEINKGFQDNTFSRQNLTLNFVQDDTYEETPLSKRLSPSSSTTGSILERTPLPKADPPLGFDPSRSVLKFNWAQPQSEALLQPFLIRNRPADASGEKMPVDVFADNYYLGQVEMNPWSIACDRSPDGRILAFVTRIGEESNSVPKLGWVDLFDVSRVHFPTLDMQPGWEIAFAPDSQHLAFIGCVEQDCGIYILDTAATEIMHVYIEAGRKVTWSQDGNFLAWLGTQPSSGETGVFIADVNNGEVVYYDEYKLEGGETPGRVRKEELSINFSDQAFGLEACSLP